MRALSARAADGVDTSTRDLQTGKAATMRALSAATPIPADLHVNLAQIRQAWRMS